MKIYCFKASASRFNSFLFNKDYWDIQDSIGVGHSLIGKWTPIPVRNLFKEDEGEFPKTAGDFPSLSGSIPVVSEKAWQILSAYIKNEVEALPLITKTGSYFALNVLDIVDGLDKEKSEISYRSSGRVSRVFKYVFHEEKIKGKYMFKIPETKGLEVYVSEEFKKLIEENNLKGLDFSKIVFTAE